MTKFIEIDEAALASHIQAASEAHLTRCLEAMEAEEEGEVVDWSFAGAPFDGCLTCTIREVLESAMPLVAPMFEADALHDAAEYLRSKEAPDLSMNAEYADWLDTQANETVAAEDFAEDGVVIPFIKP